MKREIATNCLQLGDHQVMSILARVRKRIGWGWGMVLLGAVTVGMPHLQIRMLRSGAVDRKKGLDQSGSYRSTPRLVESLRVNYSLDKLAGLSFDADSVPDLAFHCCCRHREAFRAPV